MTSGTGPWRYRTPTKGAIDKAARGVKMIWLRETSCIGLLASGSGDIGRGRCDRSRRRRRGHLSHRSVLFVGDHCPGHMKRSERGCNQRSDAGQPVEPALVMAPEALTRADDTQNRLRNRRGWGSQVRHSENRGSMATRLALQLGQRPVSFGTEHAAATQPTEPWPASWQSRSWPSCARCARPNPPPSA